MLPFYSELPIIDSDIYHSDAEFSWIHPAACLITILDGRLTLEIDGEQYPLHKETVFYLAPDTSYRVIPEQPVLLLYTWLHPCFLLQAVGFRYKYIALHSSWNPLKDFSKLISLAADLAISMPESPDQTSALVLGKAYELMDYITEAYLNPVDIEIYPEKNQNKIHQLQQYLSSHYHLPVSLSDTAAALGFTPQYLSNFMKKHLNATFQEYISTFRVEAAELYLKYTLETPVRIAAFCGFANLPAFQKTFRNCHYMSVEDYITKHRIRMETYICPPQPDRIKNSSLKMDYLFHYTNHERHYRIAAPASQVMKVTLDTNRHRPLRHSWNQMIHLGNAVDFENSAYRRHLAAMQQELHFTYGKITGIFCYMQLCKSLPSKRYDFSKAFCILDFLKSIQIKPLLELSNKPFHLYKENEQEIPDYDSYLTPEPYDHMLFSILPAFLKACINRYGYADVSTWKFELWSRYNPAMTSLEKPATYYYRFQKTAAIIKSLVPECAIGGPCFNTFLETSKFDDLLQEFRADSTYIPDFFSACYFPYIPERPYSESEPSGSLAAQSPDLMSRKLRQLKKSLSRAGLTDRPLYITEFGAYLSIGNFINDSVYPAVFLMHQISHNHDTAEILSYWLASDLSLEYGNYNFPLFGGNGILSKDGIRKPAYYAFQLLNSLGSGLIDSGDYYIAARSGDSTIQILVYYISNLNLNFSKSPENQKLLHYPYSPFEDIPPLDMHFTITGLTEGTYTLHESLLDLSHGNVLSVWGTLGYAGNLHPDDIEYLRQESRISVHGKTEILNQTYHLHTKLNTNEAKLFTLRLQGGTCHVSE